MSSWKYQFSYIHWSPASWAQPLFRWIELSEEQWVLLLSNQVVKPAWLLRGRWDWSQNPSKPQKGEMKVLNQSCQEKEMQAGTRMIKKDNSGPKRASSFHFLMSGPNLLMISWVIKPILIWGKSSWLAIIVTNILNAGYIWYYFIPDITSFPHTFFTPHCSWKEDNSFYYQYFSSICHWFLTRNG